MPGFGTPGRKQALWFVGVFVFSWVWPPAALPRASFPPLVWFGNIQSPCEKLALSSSPVRMPKGSLCVLPRAPSVHQEQGKAACSLQVCSHTGGRGVTQGVRGWEWSSLGHSREQHPHERAEHRAVVE